MDEQLYDMIISKVAPVIIPLPFCGKYIGEISITNNINYKTIDMYINGYLNGYTKFVQIEDIKTFMLENIFKIQESIVIYNQISREIIDNETYYTMKIIVKNGNRAMNYYYNTLDRRDIINYMKQYSLLAKQNGLDGISNFLMDITKNYSDKGVYKFKSKRKSLL